MNTFFDSVQIRSLARIPIIDSLGPLEHDQSQLSSTEGTQPLQLSLGSSNQFYLRPFRHSAV